MADDTRLFDGVDDNITFAGGGVVGMTYGTIACVVKFDTTSIAFAAGGLLGVYTSTSTEVLAPKIYKTGASSGFLSLMVDGTEKFIAWPNPTTTTWRLVVVAKGTGTVIPKSWVYDFGTSTWATDNADMDSSAANSARTVSKLNMGAALVDGSFLKGGIAGGAIWKNRALTNTEVHSLVNHWDDWVTLTPDALLIANQASTGTSILDSIGTSNQSAITGTTVSSADSPMVELTVGSLEQEGFRWRNDDGSETTATWAAAQDTDLTGALGTQRLRALVNATSDPASKAYTLRYKKSTDSVYQPVPTSAALTTAFGALGAAPVATATSTIDIAYPSPVTAGDLLIVGIASRLGSTSIDAEGFSALANSTQNVATSEGTAGTEAADTGGVRVTVFYKIADGTESGTVTFANTGTATLSKNGRMLSFSKPFWATWDLADCNGKMSSGATSWTAAMGSDPGIAVGDILVAVTALNTDAPTISAEAVTGTGLTSALTTEHVDVAGTGGNDTRLVITEHSVSAALTSGVPTVSFTASTGTPEGATVLTRLRATGSPPVIMQASSNITGGGQATTAQLSAPSGKSTSDFVTGRMWDDENGVDSIDITTDDYTELEWCFKTQSPAATSDVYQFRVYAGTTPLNTYTVTPQWTIGSGSTVTGTVAVTAQNATSTASGSSVVGTVARTVANFTSAASGTFTPPTVTGTVGVTLANATSAASGGHGPSGTVAQTVQSFTSAASGSSVVGTVARTLANFPGAAAGSSVVGTVAQTIANFTGAASGTSTPYTGTVAVTLANFVGSATGGHGVSGTVARTVANFTGAAAGSSVVGSVAQTVQSFVGAALGQFGSGITGLVAQTLQNFTSTASGSSTVGTVLSTVQSFTSTASGGHGVAGSVAQTVQTFTGAAAGSSVTGSLARTMQSFTSAAVGAAGGALGAVAATLQPFTSQASGAFGSNPVGTVAVTLQNFTSVASGSTVTGTVGATLQPFTSAATGTVSTTVTGTVAATMQPFVAHAFGSSGGGINAAIGSIPVTGVAIGALIITELRIG